MRRGSGHHNRLYVSAAQHGVEGGTNKSAQSMFSHDWIFGPRLQLIHDLMTPRTLDGDFSTDAKFLSTDKIGRSVAQTVRQDGVLDINDQNPSTTRGLGSPGNARDHCLTKLIFAEVVLYISDKQRCQRRTYCLFKCL